MDVRCIWWLYSLGSRVSDHLCAVLPVGSCLWCNDHMLKHYPCHLERVFEDTLSKCRRTSIGQFAYTSRCSG